jgi:hypothetical protein
MGELLVIEMIASINFIKSVCVDLKRNKIKLFIYVRGNVIYCTRYYCEQGAKYSTQLLSWTIEILY